MGAAVAPSEDAGYNLPLQTGENYVRPVWPGEEGKPLMMMHLDIEVDDLDEAVAHAVGVGAELEDRRPHRQALEPDVATAHA